MEYSVAKKEKSRVQITCALPADHWEGYRVKAEEMLGKQLQVEGFRPGQVPPDIVRRQVGEETILMEAARLAVQDAYLEVVEKEALDVIGDPELSVKKLAPGNPFEFQLEVALIPAMVLPDWRALASHVQRKEVALEEQEVQQTLEWLQKSRQEQGKELPELNDEFAKSLGAFESMDQVRSSVREGLLSEKEYRETQRHRQEILEKVAEKTKGDIPDVLIEREQSSMVENIKKGVKEQAGMEFQEYLEKVGKTEDQLLLEFAKEAEKRVKNSLILREIVKQENIQVTDEEIQAGTQRVLAQFGSPKEAEQAFDQKQLVLYTKGALENEKALALLEESAKK
ncbi:MAG: trigger factor [Candidatus Yanofskybacteria bacterium]|nr:trigger factor [Candidatus Yanofskybacteria bacterium]